MTTMELPLVRRVASWRKMLEAARVAFAAWRYGRHPGHVAPYRPVVTAPGRGAHRAPVADRRPSPARRPQAAARAPKGPRHTVAPGRWRVKMPPDWYRRFEHAHRAAWARPTVAEVLAGCAV